MMRTGAEFGTEIVPVEVDLSQAGVERVRRAARLLRAAVAEEAMRGRKAAEFRRGPLEWWTMLFAESLAMWARRMEMWRNQFRRPDGRRRADLRTISPV